MIRIFALIGAIIALASEPTCLIQHLRERVRGIGPHGTGALIDKARDRAGRRVE